MSKRILEFYQEVKRDLPWRKEDNPYYTLVSEIMLQQTRVDTVIPYFNRFIEKLPTIQDLALVSEEELMKLWQGLGYYRRAKNLQKAAMMIVDEYKGIIPSTYEDLIRIPGIGPYTAKAIMSIAFHQKAVAVDGNVLRVFSRYFGLYEDIKLDKTKREIETKVLDLFPREHASDFMQALMEIGALVCLPNGEPKCDQCPLQKECFALSRQQIPFLPTTSKKEEQRIEKRTVFIIHYEDWYWIQKRDNQGLLSSLWELPNTDGHLNEQDVASYVSDFNLPSFKINRGPKKKHVFTHIIWDMISFEIELSGEDKRLIHLENIEKNYAIPSAFQTFLIQK